MLTNNYREMVKFIIKRSGDDISFKLTNGALSEYLNNNSGEALNTANLIFEQQANVFKQIVHGYTNHDSSKQGTGVVFGDGSGIPSENDYTLFGNVVSTFNETHITSFSVEGDTVVRTVQYTITNTSSTEDITISEIGYITTIHHKQWYQYANILIDHTVLDSPVTIPAGGVGQVTYTITFNIA